MRVAGAEPNNPVFFRPDTNDIESGVTIPTGTLMPTNMQSSHGYTLQYNEYVVYDRRWRSRRMSAAMTRVAHFDDTDSPLRASILGAAEHGLSHFMRYDQVCRRVLPIYMFCVK
jgi:hypothetical protein